MTLNEWAKHCHEANVKWWQCIDTGKPIKRNPKELLMLVITELAEAVEGERKNLMDDKLPHRKMAEVEMADAFIRLCDFAAGFGYEVKEPVNSDLDYLVRTTPENKAEALLHITSVVLFIAHHPPAIVSSILLIRAYCLKHGYDLDGAINQKIEFNRTREDHKHEARRIAGGKQF